MASPKDREFPNLNLIRQGVDYRFKVRVRALELLMRPLSILEEDQITQEVIEDMSELPEEKRTSLKQSFLLSIKKLERAQTSDVGLQDGKVFQAELERMSPGEIEHLFKQYNAGCDKLNPVLETMDRKEVESWVDGLKKNSSELEMTLIGCSFFQLVALCRHLLTTGESQEGK